MISVALAAVLNLFGDVLLVPHTGIVGAGAATAVSQYAAAILLLRQLGKKGLFGRRVFQPTAAAASSNDEIGGVSLGHGMPTFFPATPKAWLDAIKPFFVFGPFFMCCIIKQTMHTTAAMAAGRWLCERSRPHGKICQVPTIHDPCSTAAHLRTNQVSAAADVDRPPPSPPPVLPGDLIRCDVLLRAGGCWQLARAVVPSGLLEKGRRYTHGQRGTGGETEGGRRVKRRGGRAQEHVFDLKAAAPAIRLVGLAAAMSLMG